MAHRFVLIDDMGFGQSSAFGGPVRMPAVEALANEGLRFNPFKFNGRIKKVFARFQ